MATRDLDEMICFSLYTASRAVSQAYRSLLAEHDLTYPQFLVLVSLDRVGEMSVGELGAAMHLDSGTMSPLLQRLESRGLVTRERRAGNERVVMLALTPEGRHMRDAVRSAVARLAPAYGIRRDEVNGLLEQLHRIAANMTDLTENVRAGHPPAATP